MLRYRYSGENWTIVDADTYSVIDNPVNYAKISYNMTKSGARSVQPIIYNTVINQASPFVFYYSDTCGYPMIFSYALSVIKPDGTSVLAYNDGIINRCVTQDHAIGSSFQAELIRGTQSTCTFKAYKGSILVVNRTQQSCPEVEYFDQCPPNTCEVLCGNTICCYNSEGISVFNYPNT